MTKVINFWEKVTKIIHFWEKVTKIMLKSFSKATTLRRLPPLHWTGVERWQNCSKCPDETILELLIKCMLWFWVDRGIIIWLLTVTKYKREHFILSRLSVVSWLYLCHFIRSFSVTLIKIATKERTRGERNFSPKIDHQFDRRRRRLSFGLD